MAVTGAHALIYTSEPEAVRAVFRDVFGWSHVDAGGSWLIFALPPTELAVHPSEEPKHEVSLMCDDLDATMGELRAKGLKFAGDPEEETFGRTAMLRLPGGSEILIYEPRHPTAI